MDWSTYKKQAESPAVWTRWMLEQSLELTALVGVASQDPPTTLRLALMNALEGPALAKPDDHRGDTATDLLPLQLDLVEVRQMLALVHRAVIEGIRTSGTMQRGLGGFQAAWTEYFQHLENLPSAQEYPTMSTASDRVLAMIEGWNQRDLDAIVDCFAEDAVYHNMPMEPLHGKDAIRAGISGFVAGASAIQWDMLQIAENDSGAVLTERLDKFQMGDKWIEVPVMGTFEVREDRIKAWRDYFDLASFQSQIE